MSTTENLTTLLTDVADAIRTKKGTTELINPQNFSEEITSGIKDTLEIAWETNKRTSMNNFITNLYTILTTIPLLDTSNVTYMSNMFKGCTKLTTIPLLDTSNVTSMNYMFQNCSALTTVPLLDTSNVTNMNNMFDGCTKLTTIPLLDTSNATSMIYTFKGCTNLTNLTLRNIKKALTIGSGTTYGHLLTVDSLVNTVQQLWDYSSGSTTYTLTMGSANLNKIASVYVKLVDATEEMIADDDLIESKMPCVVCESTDEGAMLLKDYASLKSWTLA